jgi:hypothetical protein
MLATWCIAGPRIWPSNAHHMARCRPSYLALECLPHGALQALISSPRMLAMWCIAGPHIWPLNARFFADPRIWSWDARHMACCRPSDLVIGCSPRGALSTIGSGHGMLPMWRVVFPQIWLTDAFHMAHYFPSDLDLGFLPCGAMFSLGSGC